MKFTREERLAHTNGVIQAISRHGRRFFHHEGRVGRLERDDRGHIWFIDGYSQKRIYTHANGHWRGFTNGGTLRSLIVALRDYITSGERIRGSAFGPWPDHVCGGDLWGYGIDGMAAVRAELADNPAVAFEKEAAQ